MDDKQIKDRAQEIKEEVIQHLKQEAGAYLQKKVCEICGCSNSCGRGGSSRGSSSSSGNNLKDLALPIAIVFTGLFIGIALLVFALTSGSGDDDSSKNQVSDTDKVEVVKPAPAPQPQPEDTQPVLAPPGGASDNVPPVTADDHIFGNPNAPIKLIEYSDFECPFCQRFHPTAKAVVAKYNGQVAWIYRHYPLAFHPQAQPAAEASECVAELAGNDAFWQFSDALFENQSSLGQALYEQEAQRAGANLAQFKDCLSSGKYADKIQKQFTEGSTAGISGTPGSIIIAPNGDTYPISGAVPLSQFEAIIDPLLN